MPLVLSISSIMRILCFLEGKFEFDSRSINSGSKQNGMIDCVCVWLCVCDYEITFSFNFTGYFHVLFRKIRWFGLSPSISIQTWWRWHFFFFRFKNVSWVLKLKWRHWPYSKESIACITPFVVGMLDVCRYPSLILIFPESMKSC